MAVPWSVMPGVLYAESGGWGGNVETKLTVQCLHDVKDSISLIVKKQNQIPIGHGSFGGKRWVCVFHLIAEDFLWCHECSCKHGQLNRLHYCWVEGHAASISEVSSNFPALF